jgi:Ca2+-binding RTX toxin-like protein
MPDGRIIGAGLVLTGVALAIWGFAERDADDTSSIAQPISVVQLNAGSGTVQIRTSDAPTTTVQEHRAFWLLNTGKAHHVEGDKLVLEGDCGWQCSADFIVTVPAGTKVTGKSASGDVHLEGVGDIDLDAASGNVTVTGSTGAVTLDIASGDAVVEGAAGAVDLETKSGDITANDLTAGPVKAKAASGDIDLTLTKPAAVTADGKSGDIQVHVPVTESVKYRVEADTRSGDTEINIPSYPSGTYLLKVSTASGDVQVNPAE